MEQHMKTKILQFVFKVVDLYRQATNSSEYV